MGGRKEARKPRSPCARRTPPSGTPPPALCERAPGRSHPRHPAGPVRLPPAGCSSRGRHTKPGEPAPAPPEHGEREQARTDLRGCCGRAASAGDTDRWAHGGVARGRPPLLRLRWRQCLLSPPTSLPPTPPPPSPPPPPPNHRSTEGETQRLTTTWLPPLPPLPSPRPPGARNALREKGEGRGNTHRGAAPLSGFRRFSRAAGAGRQKLCACVRSLRSRVSFVPAACAPPPSPCGLAPGSGLGGRHRRERAPDLGGAGVVLLNAGLSCLPAWGLDFRISFLSSSSRVAHCLPPARCTTARLLLPGCWQ